MLRCDVYCNECWPTEDLPRNSSTCEGEAWKVYELTCRTHKAYQELTCYFVNESVLHKIGTPWQDEYLLFCNSETLDEESSSKWWSIEDEIKRCDKVYRKRKKHKNDIKTDFIKDKTYWIEDELAGLQIYIKHKYHKHKRAEKVFTEEESEQYFSYYEWYDHDGYLAYIPVESCEGNGNCLYGTCMSCDWDKDMYGLSWDDHDFIEYWDYPDYWHSEVKKSYSENGATSSADNLPFCRNTVLPSWHKEVYEMVEFFDQFE